MEGEGAVAGEIEPSEAKVAATGPGTDEDDGAASCFLRVESLPLDDMRVSSEGGGRAMRTFLEASHYLYVLCYGARDLRKQ